MKRWTQLLRLKEHYHARNCGLDKQHPHQTCCGSTTGKTAEKLWGCPFLLGQHSEIKPEASLRHNDSYPRATRHLKSGQRSIDSSQNLGSSLFQPAQPSPGLTGEGALGDWGLSPAIVAVCHQLWLYVMANLQEELLNQCSRLGRHRP